MYSFLTMLPPVKPTSRPLLPHLADPESVGRAARDARRGVSGAADWLAVQIVAHEAWCEIWRSVGETERADELAALIRTMRDALGEEEGA
jgi:hypothetical protein